MKPPNVLSCMSAMKDEACVIGAGNYLRPSLLRLHASAWDMITGPLERCFLPKGAQSPSKQGGIHTVQEALWNSHIGLAGLQKGRPLGIGWPHGRVKQHALLAVVGRPS